MLSHADCLGHMPRSAADWECPERISEVMGGIGDRARFDPRDLELEVSSDFGKVGPPSPSSCDLAASTPLWQHEKALSNTCPP